MLAGASHPPPGKAEDMNHSRGRRGGVSVTCRHSSFVNPLALVLPDASLQVALIKGHSTKMPS